MNAKQEILELMQRSYNITCNACGQNVRPYLSDIRAILETHTLEPIDERMEYQEGMEMTPAEISLAFAREVAGRDPDEECTNGEIMDHDSLPVCTCGWSGNYSSWDNLAHKKAIPDYANDLTAVDKAVKATGLEWEKNHNSWLPFIGAKKIRVGTFSVRKIPKEKEPSGFWYAVDQEPGWEPYRALCLAAIKCVRESKG